MYRYFSNSNCMVPTRWTTNHSLISVYSLSSLLYSFNGILILYFCLLYPDLFERTEAFIWIWQGIISYLSDAYYLGKVSIFHPVDRYSSIVVTYLLVSKYLTISGIVCCYERYHLLCYSNTSNQLLTYELIVGLSYSFTCFYYSIKSIKLRNIDSFYIYHTLWHTGFPLTSVGFHTILLMNIPLEIR